MKRQDRDFWKVRVDEQQRLGISAAEYCRRRTLQRGTFLRWRRKITGMTDAQELVEITDARPHEGHGRSAALAIRLEDGLLIRFREMPDADVVARFVSAIRAASAI